MKLSTIALFLLSCWTVTAVQAQRPRPPLRRDNAGLTYLSPNHRFSLQFPHTVRERQIGYDRNLPDGNRHPFPGTDEGAQFG